MSFFRFRNNFRNISNGADRTQVITGFEPVKNATGGYTRYFSTKTNVIYEFCPLQKEYIISRSLILFVSTYSRRVIVSGTSGETHLVSSETDDLDLSPPDWPVIDKKLKVFTFHSQ